MSCIVYEATCQVHGKSYVGQTRNMSSRLRSHKHAAQAGSNSLFHRAIRKHGIDRFDFKVRAELPTQQEAKIAEMLLIATERPEYNMSAGGDGAVGVRHSFERREQQRNAMLGRTHTAETKAAIGRAHQGKTVGAETRRRLSETAQRRDPLRHPMLGRSHSEETRAKISATKRARAAARKLAGEVK